MTHPALSQLDHRPWPVPRRRWTWRQNWLELLFAHWPVPASRLRHLVPAPLRIQEFAGTSWVGVVPFRMTGVMRRPFPDLPWISAFPELNLRLYVELDGRPGVWFVSLDATNPLAIWAARRLFRLPYHRARISFERERAGVRFRSARLSNAPPISFSADYQPTSAPFVAAANSLEAFLVERYCLYAADRRGNLFRAEVHHAPWQLQTAAGRVDAAQLLRAYNIEVGNQPPLLHYSERVTVVVWGLERANAR